ncbi:polysaccharide lyase beta-sandwich domain-containing protein [Reichenbachiella carrageenanivorans]|uniref:Polysaccharide lyase beta-sandwich domain-containing protein n=1 Tax=Reichenbachiella carrageenanivorans TaxID=2979869 RepID=A0ABY6D860_9BACT|nr:polysaccharide lyase beta-sandwich domain-containing protein [Reichenbachiella carrageenanivorans]UXX81363.1 polysaccharide lyase beta-sandwich domain-containing protein [Reichenbachiella carrageenanivorans]
MVPDISLADFKNYVRETSSVTLINSSNIQAVYHQADQVLEAVFYEPGTFTYGEGQVVAVNQKAILMLRESDGKLYVSAANPVHRGLKPSFVSGSNTTIGELPSTPLQVTLKGFDIEGEAAGTKIVLLDLPTDRAYEGGTVTETLTLLSDGGLGSIEVPYLDGIKIDNVEIEGFDPKKLYYVIALDHSDQVSVAGLTNEAYTISTIETEKNTWNIVVSHDGVSTTYKLQLERPETILGEITPLHQARVYPNPFADYIQIESPYPFQRARIYSANGQLVSSHDLANGSQVSLALLQPHLTYYLQLIGDGYKETHQLIKE